MSDFIANARKWVNDNFVFFCFLTIIGIVVIAFGVRWLSH